MGSVLTLAPALTIGENDLQRAFDILDASFADGRRRLTPPAVAGEK